MNIVAVEYIKDYQLKVVFDDGDVRIADFGEFLRKAKNPMSTQFRDIKKFKKVKIDHGDLSWKDEMDFPADEIYKGKYSPKQPEKETTNGS